MPTLATPRPPTPLLFIRLNSFNYSLNFQLCCSLTQSRAAGTGQARQAKAGPLFLDSPLYGIDRQIIVLGNDRQASIFVCVLSLATLH